MHSAWLPKTGFVLSFEELVAPFSYALLFSFSGL